MTATLELERAQTEDELVLDWRLEQLVRAGYDDRTASELAFRNDVDLHLATDLLRMGCPPEIALNILL